MTAIRRTKRQRAAFQAAWDAYLPFRQRRIAELKNDGPLYSSDSGAVAENYAAIAAVRQHYKSEIYVRMVVLSALAASLLPHFVVDREDATADDFHHFSQIGEWVDWVWLEVNHVDHVMRDTRKSADGGV